MYEKMNAVDIVVELVGRINSLKIDLDVANHSKRQLTEERDKLVADNSAKAEEIEALKKKIEDLEF